MTRTFADSVIDAARRRHLLEVMGKAADAARQHTLHHFRQSLVVDNKAAGGGFDPVTVADREAEQSIRQVLLDECPGFGFLGEEGEGVASTIEGEPTWVVDPIDGTRAFITGLPLWGTLIALHVDGDVMLGLLDQPFLGERFVGMPGTAELHHAGGTTALRTRQDRTLRQAILQTTTPDMFTTDTTRAAFDRISTEVAMTRYGGDCYAYALLAMGLVDVVIESDLQPYDVQAVIAIVRGAGGVFTDWQGGSAASGGSVVAAGSEALHGAILESLARS